MDLTSGLPATAAGPDYPETPPLDRQIPLQRPSAARRPTAQAARSFAETKSGWRRRRLDDRFHQTGSHGTGDSFVDSSFVFDRTRSDIMARWRQACVLGMRGDEIGRLGAIARSRSEAARRVERAQILLTYRENPSFFAVGQRLGVHHQTVERCVERAMAYGPLAALDDRPRPGKEPTITPEAKAWLVSLACEKAKEH